MSLIHFYNPVALAWLWLVPAGVVLFLYAAVKRKRAVMAFGASGALVSRKREAFSSCAAVALVVLALARPAWDLQERQLQETGRDVIFLLDVSRSMLAEDMHPNRLENAKTAILDCVDEISGDRVGLVLFAGSAEIRCPLTVDYDYFRMALHQASPDSVTAGGTMIANAIDKTVDKLIDPEKKGLQDVILITDGEDMVEGADEVDAARKLGEAGARLIAIGIGDRSRGSRIATEDAETGETSFMKHDNREVWTKLHSETLRQMSAVVPDGTYFEVANGPFDLRHIYRQTMEHAQRTSVEKQVMESYEEKFPLFLGGAVALLLLSHRWRRKA
ncbi:MAG: VWA domain-containing protein [Kiritimatiellales bacterium]|nr:VWA domain-containing protein [Kiritimatiellales bacterium]MCF7864759.1 VWA domain-containing protein [Kiritimatiellales bacterium]